MIISLVATYGLAVLLVREPRMAPRSRTRAGALDAFRLDTDRHRGFVHVVVARFFFLLGTYAVGRFLLFFVAYRLGVAPGEAAAQAGMLLALLTLVTTLAAPLGGWAADLWGRLPLMTAGALLSMIGVLGRVMERSCYDRAT